MRLPNAARAVVDPIKVQDYLLDPNHPQNGGKAGLFGRFGFRREAAYELVEAIAAHPLENFVLSQTQSPYGQKFTVRCTIQTPDGRNPCRTTVWLIDANSVVPRLLTAY